MTPQHARDPIAQAKRNWLAWGWDGAAEGMAAVTSVMRAQQLILSRVELALKPYGISFARFEMLRLLAFTSERRMPMSRARDLLQVHPASITSIVNRLESDGLVLRSAHPADRRSVMVELTDAGAELVAKATDSLNSEVFEDLGLARRETTALTTILTEFRRRSGDFD